MATEKNPYRFVLKEHRLSYVHLKTAVAFEDGGTPKYGVTVLIPKDHPDVARIEGLLEAYYAEKKTEHFKAVAMTHKNFWYPLRDGDEAADEMEAKGKNGDAYRGCMFIKATSVSQVNVFDEQGEDVIDLDEVYSGCYGRVSITLWAYSKKGVGISAILNSVKKTDDGEPLGSAGGTHDEYNDEDEAPVSKSKPAAGRPAAPVAAKPIAPPKPAPRPAAPKVQEPQWATDDEGRDIYSYDGENWEYAD